MIHRIRALDIPQAMIVDAIRDGILFTQSIDYLGYFDGDVLIAFAGYKTLSRSAWLKCDYVMPNYRRKGIMTELTKRRLEILRGCNIYANCTPASVGLHIRLGAGIVRTYKNGIVRVVYENLH